MGLAARHDPSLSDVVEDLFPYPARAKVFQPEPGCSGPTFVGSAMEVNALAATMLTAALGGLHSAVSGNGIKPLSAWTVRLPQPWSAVTPPTQSFGWDNETLIDDAHSGFQIRLSRDALRQMHREALLTSRLHGPDHETGGMLLGHIDNACRVVWVDQAIGPSPDSEQSPHFFRHGTEGVQARIATAADASGRRIRFTCMWRTHPGGLTQPSSTDQYAMSRLMVPVPKAPPQAVLLILGGPPDVWRSWVQGGMGIPRIFARLVRAPGTAPPKEPIAL